MKILWMILFSIMNPCSRVTQIYAAPASPQAPLKTPKIVEQIYDPFEVKFAEDRTIVKSAQKYVPKTYLVLENNTQEKLYLKIEIPNQHMDRNLTLRPKDETKIVIEMKETDTITLTCISPPLQELKLAFKKEDYAFPL